MKHSIVCALFVLVVAFPISIGLITSPIAIVGASSAVLASTAVATGSPTAVAQDVDVLQPVISLLETNGNCTLPCWWGLKPEISTVSDIKTLLRKTLNRETEAPFVREDGLIDYYLNLIFVPHDDSSLYLAFTTKNDVLTLTSVTFVEPNLWLPSAEWGPSQLLKQMGEPTDIYIDITPATKSFWLYVVFNDKGVMVEYGVAFQGDQFNEGSNSILLCPRAEQITYSKMWLQNQAVDMMAEHLLRNPTKPTSEYFHTLKATTGLEISAFAKLLATDPESCIKALAYQQ